MKKWKMSRYMYLYKDNMQGVVLSTVSGAIIILDSYEMSCVENFRDKEFDSEDMPNELFEALREQSFIVLADSDELKEIIDAHYGAINASDVLHLTLFITDECCFNCSYCFVNKEKQNVMTRDVFAKVFGFVEKHLDDYLALDISWFGGEPLERLDFLIEYNSSLRDLCRKHNKGFEAFAVTNGYDLTLHNTTKLYEAGIHSYQVTFDGDEEDHDKVRIHQEGGATFKRIFKNLMSLRYLPYQNLNIGIRCNMNSGSIDSFINKYTKFFANDKRFSISLKPIVNYDSDSEKELLSIYAGKGKEVCDIACKYRVLDDFIKDKFFERKRWCSTLSKHSHVVSPEGKLYTCDSTMNNPKYCLGEIGSERDIKWNETFDTTYLEHKIEGQCLTCRKLPLCYGSCQRIYYKLKKHACALSDNDIKFYMQYIIQQEERDRGDYSG